MDSGVPVTYLRPSLSPTGPTYFAPCGIHPFEQPTFKNGEPKLTRKRSTDDRMIFRGGALDGRWIARRLANRKSNWSVRDYSPGFDPKTRPECRQYGDGFHAGWYFYDEELDVMVWHGA